MADQDRARAHASAKQAGNPVPVTPSEDTERPEGVAFDVGKGAGLRGVPVGDQRPANPGSAPGRERGDGVGLAVPGDAIDEAEAEGS
jgi:hypothetical protein